MWHTNVKPFATGITIAVTVNIMSVMSLHSHGHDTYDTWLVTKTGLLTSHPKPTI